MGGTTTGQRPVPLFILAPRMVRALRAEEAEEAERSAQSFEDLNANEFRILRQAMTDAGIAFAGPQDADSVARHFTEALKAAEAKLATAVEALQEISKMGAVCPDYDTCTHKVCSDSCGACLTAINAIHVLGIDPSKEQGK